MSWLTLSPEEAIYTSTPVENLFIDHYLGQANGDYVKVYLYALRCALAPVGTETPSLVRIAQYLNLTEARVRDAFLYWESKRLMTVLNLDPLTVQVRMASRAILEGDQDTDLALLEDVRRLMAESSQQLLPAQAARVRDWMDLLGLDGEAVLHVLRHVREQRRDHRIDFDEADRTARQLKYNNMVRGEDARHYLRRVDLRGRDCQQLLQRMGAYNRLPTEAERERYDKWVEWGFDAKAIEVASDHMNVGNPNMGYLESILEDLHQLGLHTASAINRYYLEKTDRDRDTKRLMKAARLSGASWEAVKALIQTYQARGIALEAMCLMAELQASEAKGSLSLQDVERGLETLERQGIKTELEAMAYCDERREASSLMHRAVTCWGELRSPTPTEIHYALERLHRGVAPALLMVAAEAAQYARGNRLSYMDSILHSWEEKGIVTEAAARADVARTAGNHPAQNGQPGVHFDYERTFDDHTPLFTDPEDEA